MSRAASPDSDVAAAARLMRRYGLPALAAVAMLAVYVAAELRPLWNDGFYYLARVLTIQHALLPTTAREAAEVMMQLPLLAATRLGITDLGVLAFVFCLGVQLVPLGLTACAWFALPAEKKHLFLFPLLTVFAGTLGLGFGVMSSGSTTAAYVWLLLFLILFRADRARGLDLAVALAVPAVWMGEAMVFLAPLIVVAAATRLRRARGLDAWLLGAVIVWMLIAIGAQAHWIVNPTRPEHRDGFVRGIVEFWWATGREGEINVPALVGVIGLGALGAMALLRIRRGAASTMLVNALAVGYAAGAVALLAWAWIDDRMLAIGPQFSARNIDAVLTLPLALSALLALWWPRIVDAIVFRHALRACAVMGAVALAWHVNATVEWSRYLDVARRVLASAPGFIEWDSAVAGLPAKDRRILRSLNNEWVLEAMSLVLAPRGTLTTIVGRLDVPGWRPFDPRGIAAYRSSRYWNLTPYLDAFAKQQAGRARQP